MKVLVVDDGASNRKLLRAVLESENIGVVEAWDGVRALEILETEPIDAIISDILMPRMDGFRLCQEIRKSGRWREVAFIFYTATYTAGSDEKLCFALGGDKYLLKPARRDKILSVLGEAVSASRNRASQHEALPPEAEVMKEYSERLVAKLEQKNEELKRATSELERANRELEDRVQQRTIELKIANRELESFSFSVSHDLRSPLNHIQRYLDILMKDCGGQLDPAHFKNLQSVRVSAQRLSELIEALLDLSHVTRAALDRKPVDLTSMATEVLSELRQHTPTRAVVCEVNPRVKAQGDPVLLRIVLNNLLGNAWKYTRKNLSARIEFGASVRDGKTIYFVRDNGVGFDMAQAERLFTAFQRLHGSYEFEGHGIGLATVRRVVARHGGTIYAESIDHQGATFYFTLGEKEDERPEPSRIADGLFDRINQSVLNL
jgi:hypothetical protein